MLTLPLGGKPNMSYKDAALEVAKELLCKYYHNTVSCVSFRTIATRVEGTKMLKEKGKENSKAVKDYKDPFEKKNTRFDISTDDADMKAKYEEDRGVKMG